ncbi:MAG TPA: hypothetical protein VGJ92_14120 [Methanocella sp.]
MAWVKNAADQARFSGLAKEADGSAFGAPSVRRGCEPVLDIIAPEKPGRTARRSKSGPDLRIELAGKQE